MSRQLVMWDLYQTDEALREIAFPARKRLEYIASKISPRSKVLNIGVGSGYLESLLIQAGVDIYCLEPSNRTIEQIREKFSLSEEKAKVGVAQSIPFPDEIFDVVIMTEVLEHINPGETETVLKEVRRVLKKGGIFIGTVPADEDLSKSIVVCPYCNARFHRWGHMQSFSKQRLYDLLKRFFGSVEVKRIYFLEWQQLNWKGKIIALFKMLQALMYLEGSNQNFFFEAVKSR